VAEKKPNMSCSSSNRARREDQSSRLLILAAVLGMTVQHVILEDFSRSMKVIRNSQHRLTREKHA